MPCGRALKDCAYIAVDISTKPIESKIILFIGELFRLYQIYRDCENSRQYLHGGMQKGVRGAKNAAGRDVNYLLVLLRMYGFID